MDLQWKSNICKVGSVPSPQQRLIVKKGGSYELHLGKLETSENSVWGAAWWKTSKRQPGKLRVRRRWVAHSAQSLNQHFSLIRNTPAKYDFKKNHLSESESEKGYKKKSFQNVYEPQGNVNPTWVLQAQRHSFGVIFLWVSLYIFK